MNMEGMPMTISELSRSRPAAESSSKPRLRATIGSLITRVRLWLSKPFSFAFARVLMIFLVGFAAGIAWQSYGGWVRKAIDRWFPHLAWLAPEPAPAGGTSQAFQSAA